MAPYAAREDDTHACYQGMRGLQADGQALHDDANALMDNEETPTSDFTWLVECLDQHIMLEMAYTVFRTPTFARNVNAGAAVSTITRHHRSAP